MTKKLDSFSIALARAGCSIELVRKAAGTDPELLVPLSLRSQPHDAKRFERDPRLEHPLAIERSRVE